MLGVLLLLSRTLLLLLLRLSIGGVRRRRRADGTPRRTTRRARTRFRPGVRVRIRVRVVLGVAGFCYLALVIGKEQSTTNLILDVRVLEGGVYVIGVSRDVVRFREGHDPRRPALLDRAPRGSAPESPHHHGPVAEAFAGTFAGATAVARRFGLVAGVRTRWNLIAETRGCESLAEAIGARVRDVCVGACGAQPQKRCWFMNILRWDARKPRGEPRELLVVHRRQSLRALERCPSDVLAVADADGGPDGARVVFVHAVSAGSRGAAVSGTRARGVREKRRCPRVRRESSRAFRVARAADSTAAPLARVFECRTQPSTARHARARLE